MAPVRAPARSPKLNGAVERAQRTHTEGLYEVRPFAPWTVDAINREACAWERVYNTIPPIRRSGLPTLLQFLRGLPARSREAEASRL